MTPLASFEDRLNTVVIGASGSIGAAVAAALAHHPRVGRVLACSRKGMAADHPKITPCTLDLENEPSLAQAAEAAGPDLDLVFIATGILHQAAGLTPEKSWSALDGEAMARALRVNAIGPALVAKHFLPRLRRDHKAVLATLSARVGSIEDNRLGGWHSYRASKAALNMLVRTLAVELARRKPEALCVALHPGTVATPLSAPFRSGVPKERLFTPDYAAERLLEVLDGLTAQDSGGLFAWDGSRIPF